MKNFDSNTQQTLRIAIMGGTFDPIHCGHLSVAENVLKEFNIQKMIFIPTGLPPHKKNFELTNKEDRFFMVKIAINSNPKFECSRLEIDRSSTTYTIDTIIEIKKIFNYISNLEIFFILGADALDDITTWKNFENLFKICSFIVVNRSGYNKSLLKQKISYFRQKYNCRIYYIDIPNLSISSTDIRFRIKYNKNIKYLVPDNVIEYIKKHNLYKENIVDLIIQKAENTLSTKRFIHSLAVAEESKKLAMHYGVNTHDAMLCGYLHDLAKELSQSKMFYMCKKYNIKIDKIMQNQIYLAHSFVSACMAKDFFGIYDENILDAIRYHTTGRKNMTILDKILFISDAIEPNRKHYENLDTIRFYAYKNIDKAIVLILEQTIEYNMNKNREIHNLSIEALNSLKSLVF